jgi:hypothetical protein
MHRSIITETNTSINKLRFIRDPRLEQRLLYLPLRIINQRSIVKVPYFKIENIQLTVSVTSSEKNFKAKGTNLCRNTCCLQHASSDNERNQSLMKFEMSIVIHFRGISI